MSKTQAAALVTSTLDDLHLLKHIISFVGRYQYRFIAATNHRFQEAYEALYPGYKITYLNASTEKIAKMCWNEIDHENVYPQDREEELSGSAAAHGNLPVVKFLRSLHCRWNERTCAYAAKNGHLHVLKWCRANGCPWNEQTCSGAARYGRLNVLRWCRENGCPWDAHT